MLVICEDCSKKYAVDESKIKGSKARFFCQKCGHNIIAVKPTAQAGNVQHDERAQVTVQADKIRQK